MSHRYTLPHTWPYCLALASVVAITPAAVHAAPLAAAVRHYDIPAGTLDQVLNRYASESNLLLSVDSKLTAGRASPGLHGDYAVEAGFSTILSGSGLDAVSDGTRGGYVLRTSPVAAPTAAADAVLPAVTVNARAARDLNGLPVPYAGGQVATGGRVGMLGNRDVMDTPFNTVSYTRQLIQDQQAYSVSDVLANNPSVRILYPDNDGSTDFFIRGNKVSQLDIAYDGLYGIGTPGIESLERIEVLMGANALLNGLGPIGGVGAYINQVPKKATGDRVAQLSFGYIGGQFGGSVDVGQRFGAQKQFGIRFNGAYRDGDTEADHQSRKVGTATLSMDWRSPDDHVRLSTNFGYRENDNDSPARTLYMFSSTFKIPAPPSDPKLNWQNAWSYDNTRTTFATARGEVDITPGITAYAAIGGSQFREEQLFANSFLLNGNGDIGQNQVYWPLYRNTISGETGVRGTLQTGPVKHNWSLALSGLRENNGIVATTLETTYTNLYRPVFIAQPGIAGLADADNVPRTTETELYGIAFADTMSVLHDRLQVTLGLRQQGVSAKNYSTAGVPTSSYDKSALTPAVGLNVRATEDLSLYANYIEGLQQGGQAPTGYSNAGQSFAPFVSKQYEVGAKYDFGSLMATLSAYQISTPNAQADGLVYAVNGEQRTRGLELNTYGEIARGVRLLGGAALIDARQTHTANGTNDGKRVTGAANFQLNLGAEWDPVFLPGWTVSGRAIYTGSEYIDASNQQSIPSWVRLDAGVRYTTVIAGHQTAFRFNVENLTNRSYWVGGQGFVMQSRPRTFLGSVSIAL
ncbi:TonB-dependent receptor [Paraburkholderia acidisoli]|uniref:TonB-dependent siderophore receptor n=1 Tax=Paraburkholderia acidisoli TaxID=2571748 RepID=A0A7Z2GN00_9BURK|nr:TonB-dependent receptor [Paraburkholderia acidisoli]QGZ64574.1 TonB-dependent siderophore receptor [Paraburkholderia acidisoli]